MSYAYRYGALDPVAIGGRLQKTCAEKGISVRQLQQAIGLESVQAVYRWLNGQNIPSVDNLVRLAKYLQVSIDYLLMEDSTAGTNELDNDPEKRKVQKEYEISETETKAPYQGQ